ncbi:MAG: hypothetical protein ACXVUL_18935 [Solirubrobacteraceae bacterium]
MESPQGVIFPTINISWWSAQINNLEQSADATHLPIYVSNDVLLVQDGGCCVIGYHGTRAAGNGGGNGGSNGNAVVQTFARASWVRPGDLPSSAGIAEPDRLGATGHPRAQPRDCRVGRRSIRQ